ncbi:MAG: hypothetical protein RXR43_14410 [Sulfolobus sp.]
MNWKINVVTMFIITFLSLLFSLVNVFISSGILVAFYLIDILIPPFYPADVMEKPIVFLSPILVIAVTIYILVRLFFNNLVFFIFLLVLFVIDLILSSNKAKN